MKMCKLVTVATLALLVSAEFSISAQASGEGIGNPIRIPTGGGTYFGNLPNGVYSDCWYNITSYVNHTLHVILYTPPNETVFWMELFGPYYRDPPGHVGNITFTTDWEGSWSIRVVLANASQGGNYTLVVDPTNNLPNTPSAPSGPTAPFVYTNYNYSTKTTDIENDMIYYEFNWNDSTPNNYTAYVPSNTTVTAQHQWSFPKLFYPKVRARDIHGNWSAWSSTTQVNVTQNDANSGRDAGGAPSDAVTLPAGSYDNITFTSKGTLYHPNASLYPSDDAADFYNFTLFVGDLIYTTMTPPPGVNFNLELHGPAGFKTGSYNGSGIPEGINYGADVSGTWSVRVSRASTSSGEGQYNFTLKVVPNHATLTISVPQAPPEGVTVTIDGRDYTAYASTPVSVILAKGKPYVIHAQDVFDKFNGIGWYVYTFDYWSDGNETNPRTITLTGNLSLSAIYWRSKYPYL
jgi:hypothetical protein